MKKIGLLIYMILIMSLPVYSSDLVGDFDGDGEVTLKDVVILLAYYQTPSGERDLPNKVLSKAQKTLYNIKTIERLPINEIDSLSGNQILLGDVVLMLAWYQTPLQSRNSYSAIITRANKILPGSYALDKLPGTSISTALPEKLKIVNFPASVIGLNSMSLQIRLRNVDASYVNSVSIPCINGQTGKSINVTWVKSQVLTIPDGLVMLSNEGAALYEVSQFNALTFDSPLPNNTIVEIYNLDTKQIVTSKTVTVYE